MILFIIDDNIQFCCSHHWRCKNSLKNDSNDIFRNPMEVYKSNSNFKRNVVILKLSFVVYVFVFWSLRMFIFFEIENIFIKYFYQQIPQQEFNIVLGNTQSRAVQKLPNCLQHIKDFLKQLCIPQKRKIMEEKIIISNNL